MRNYRLPTGGKQHLCKNAKGEGQYIYQPSGLFIFMEIGRWKVKNIKAHIFSVPWLTLKTGIAWLCTPHFNTRASIFSKYYTQPGKKV